MLGHPVHAELVQFPLGLLALLPIWDVLAWLHILPQAASVAFWTQLAGLVTSAPAAATGARDLFAQTDDASLLSTGLRHAMLAVCSIATYAVAFAVRSPTAPPGWGVLALDLLASGCLIAAGWLGGHLVFHHRAGIDTGRG
jgi:uncharacterized membrane protein